MRSRILNLVLDQASYSKLEISPLPLQHGRLASAGPWTLSPFSFLVGMGFGTINYFLGSAAMLHPWSALYSITVLVASQRERNVWENFPLAIDRGPSTAQPSGQPNCEEISSRRFTEYAEGRSKYRVLTAVIAPGIFPGNLKFVLTPLRRPLS